jgi:hypothetical protein
MTHAKLPLLNGILPFESRDFTGKIGPLGAFVGVAAMVVSLCFYVYGAADDVCNAHTEKRKPLIFPLNVLIGLVTRGPALHASNRFGS